MFYIRSKNYRAAEVGSIRKLVRCEKCACWYRYEMVRRGEGVGTAPAGFGETSAEGRAQKRAREQLSELLKRGVDPVPCPDCGWFQEDMVREYVYRRYCWLLWIGWPAMVIGLGFGATLGAAFFFSPPPDPMTMAGFWMIGILVVPAPIGLAMLAIYWLLRRECDLNMNRGGSPAPLPGQPSATRVSLTDGTSPAKAATPAAATDSVAAIHTQRAAGTQADGIASETPTLAYQRPAPHPMRGGWFAIQLHNMPCPESCCACLAVTSSVFNLHPAWHLADIPVRLCPGCHVAYQVRRFQLICATIVLSPLVTGVVAYLIASKLGTDGKRAAISFAVLGGILGVIVAPKAITALCRPIQFRNYSRRRNTMEIRFRNSIYNGVFRDERE